MNMVKQVTAAFLKEVRSGKVGYTASLYPSPAEPGGWEGFYTGFVIGEYKGNGSIDHIGYIKWSDGIGWGKIRVRPNSTWRAVEV